MGLSWYPFLLVWCPDSTLFAPFCQGRTHNQYFYWTTPTYTSSTKLCRPKWSNLARTLTLRLLESARYPFVWVRVIVAREAVWVRCFEVRRAGTRDYFYWTVFSIRVKTKREITYESLWSFSEKSLTRVTVGYVHFFCIANIQFLCMYFASRQIVAFCAYYFV